MKGHLFVFSGPSGVGKGTILRKVLKRLDNITFSVSCTTRKPCAEDIEGKSIKEKIELLQKHRRDQWHQLKMAVYKRRGWNKNGIPTLATVKRLGIDYPEVVELLNRHLKPEDEFTD